MTAFWENDLDIFFNDFGVDATFGGSTIKVHFFNEYQASTLLNVSVDTRNPYLIAQDSEVSGVDQGDTFVIDGTTYYVVGVEPDGTGISVIQLSKTSPP